MNNYQEYIMSPPSMGSTSMSCFLSTMKKKPGRKLDTSEPASKRMAQNRKAQRAYRQRKENYITYLEDKVKSLEEGFNKFSSERQSLIERVAQLENERRMGWGSGNNNATERPPVNCPELTTSVAPSRSPVRQTNHSSVAPYPSSLRPESENRPPPPTFSIPHESLYLGAKPSYEAPRHETSRLSPHQPLSQQQIHYNTHHTTAYFSSTITSPLQSSSCTTINSSNTSSLSRKPYDPVLDCAEYTNEPRMGYEDASLINELNPSPPLLYSSPAAPAPPRHYASHTVANSSTSAVIHHGAVLNRSI